MLSITHLARRHGSQILGSSRFFFIFSMTQAGAQRARSCTSVDALCCEERERRESRDA